VKLVGPECEYCNGRMVKLSTIDGGIYQCSCGNIRPFKLKPGQKSVLVEGLVGEKKPPLRTGEN